MTWQLNTKKTNLSCYNGYFLRIVSEASYEELNSGKNIKEITPFWRIVNPKSNLAKKLACGINFIKIQREIEGLDK